MVAAVTEEVKVAPIMKEGIKVISVIYNILAPC